MQFRDILLDLLRTTPGSVGALFLDSEGESVEVVTERPFDAGDHDLRVIGAYAGIFLSQLRRIATTVDGGNTSRFKAEFAETTIFCTDLQDGYYLVLVADATAVEGIAWRRLDLCRGALLAEM